MQKASSPRFPGVLRCSGLLAAIVFTAGISFLVLVSLPAGAQTPAITPVSGTVTTVAGNGTACTNPTASPACGDGGLATGANLGGPMALAFDALGNLYIAEYWNNRVRRVDAVTHTITTVAGNGT